MPSPRLLAMFAVKRLAKAGPRLFLAGFSVVPLVIPVPFGIRNHDIS
jgi:hypothetical protein